MSESNPLLHGPITTSRMGKVLTVDITAPHNNMVVERGSTLPRASLIVTNAAQRIIGLSKDGDKVNTIAVAGSQIDPTTHPDLREIAENLRALRDKWFPKAKLCLFSSSFDTEVETNALRSALAGFDRIFVDFEWGTAKTFTSLTGSKGPVLTALTKLLGAVDRVIVQARFVKGDADNSTDSEVKGWIKKLQEVKPTEVHIIEGKPTIPGVKLRAAPKSRTQAIADEVAEKTGLTVSVQPQEQLLASA